VYATAHAIAQARELLPSGTCVEREVARLALAGRLSRYRHDGECTRGTPDRWANGDGWCARVTRSVGRLDQTRPAWLVVEVIAQPRRFS
jgi:hypothetical protein